jgi:ABC-2 type transport system ATP-binding protein
MNGHAARRGPAPDVDEGDARELMDEAERVADQIAVIDHGRIVAEGSAAALQQQTGGRTLEDAFIALTGHSIRGAEAAPVDRMRMIRRAWLGRR